MIGAGLGATQVIDIFAPARPPNAVQAPQRASRSIDDDRSRWAERVAGVPVVGGTQQLEGLFAKGYFDSAVIVDRHLDVRPGSGFASCAATLGIPLTNAIDRTARICTDVELGAGNVICAYCHFGVGTRIGDNNMLSAYNSFDHHNVLGTDITTGPGCVTSGLVRIGDRVRLGTGIFVEPHLEIGEGAQVASGAVIVTSVPPAHAVKRRVAHDDHGADSDGGKARVEHRPPKRRSTDVHRARLRNDHRCRPGVDARPPGAAHSRGSGGRSSSCSQRSS